MFNKTKIYLVIVLLIFYVPFVAYSVEEDPMTRYKSFENTPEMKNFLRQLESLRKAKESEPRIIYVNTRYLKDPLYTDFYEAVTEKIEHIASQNIPQIAQVIKEEVSALVGLKIKTDGSLHDVHLYRKTGIKEVDDAVIKIANTAAPFVPIPENMKTETDFLVIMNVWRIRPNAEVEKYEQNTVIH